MNELPQLKEQLYPIAKLFSYILFINSQDLKNVGTDKALSVMSVKVDLEKKEINEAIELEKHLKFNPWEEVMLEEERKLILTNLISAFPIEEIEKEIIEPLTENTSKQ